MITNLFKKYPLSIFLIAIIWFLCMFTPPHTPLEHVPFIDKWTHLVMYGGFCLVIWFEYLRRHKTLCWRRLVIWALVAPVLMSGAVELAQAYCTANRSGEWLDLVANSLGVLVGNLLGYFVLRPVVWK